MTLQVSPKYLHISSWGSRFQYVCCEHFFSEGSYFSWVYRSWLIRTLLEASLGILSNRYFAVPNGLGLLQNYIQVWNSVSLTIVTTHNNRCSSSRLLSTDNMWWIVKYEGKSCLDVGGVAWKASETLLLSFRNSSEAWSAANAIPWDFSVFPSSRIKPWK